MSGSRLFVAHKITVADDEISVERRPNAKRMKTIQVEPNELVILGKHFYQRLQHFNLTNCSNQRIAYKVRSTHPDSYIVKPAVGFLDPKESILIRVLLYKYNDETFKENHSLEVFTLPVGLEDPILKTQFWKEAARKNVVPASLKLRIRFGKASSRRFRRSRNSATTQYLIKTLENIRERRKEGQQEAATSGEQTANEQGSSKTRQSKRTKRSSNPNASITPNSFAGVAEDEQFTMFNDFVHFVETYSDVLSWLLFITLVMVIIAYRK
uniref:Major sperm protein n=1 Tax=Trichuris muris TaxID=70415 RepID=A0A5S6QG89_TRIMR